MPDNPLAEVFGFPVADMSVEAVNHRRMRLCPFGNPSGPNCTKVSATDPIGVCSIWDRQRLAVTCPIRMRQDNLFLADASDFFFSGQHCLALTEVRLNDGYNRSAGNIDVVLAMVDENQRVLDFGAIEVQTVYISGNVSAAFRTYMQDPASNFAMEWPRRNYPSPDYLSSSRKRLAPQLMFKGGILHTWQKKMAVVVHQAFYDQLPPLETVDVADAEIAWLIYDFETEKTSGRYRLFRSDVRYTKFASALSAITVPTVGSMSQFVRSLEDRIERKKFQGSPEPTPLAPTVEPLAVILGL